MKLLGVLETFLEKDTAVSTEVATQMLIGTLSQFSADIGVATTGIAGSDGGTPQISVGTVDVRKIGRLMFIVET